MRRLVLALAAACLLSGPAHADEPGRATFLPRSARAIPRVESASRDTPAFEYAYGPRAQATLGAEVALAALPVQPGTLRAGFAAFVAIENGTADRVFPPAELWRGMVAAYAALSLPKLARAWFGPGSMMELTLMVGHESDHEVAPYVLPDPRRAIDIPFGGGGNFVAPDVALRAPIASHLALTLRVQDRIYLNAFPLIVGNRFASDVVADDLHEGLTHAPGLDLGLRWQAAPAAAPIVSLFAEHGFAHDPQARDEVFVRALAGLGLTGELGELLPFASVDAGNGKGLLINRREVRASLGVRYAPF